MMIEIRQLSIDLGEFHLRDVNLAINDGEYLVLLGPTGAGKTVLLECIVGIYRPKTGRIVVDGVDVTGLYPEERNVGFVPQDYALFPNMTVKQNIAYGLKAQKATRAEIEAKTAEMMESLGIAHLHHRLPLNLSGGERQRVALGRALTTRPRILLLDEPLSALDENLRAELAAELVRIQRAVHGTFLHVCHSFEEAADVADRIAIMNNGTIAQVGTIADVIARPASLFVARFTRARNFLDGTAVPAEPGCRIELGGGASLAASRSDVAGEVTAVIRPEDVEVINGSVADRAHVLRARVASVRRKPMAAEITLDAPVPLIVLDRSGRAAEARVGDELLVRIPPEAVKVFRRVSLGT
ncbi:MAG TPA: ABC transporter ATP-binding protein [Planctomycetota bacterium]|nr:ABC transporter ATP-binding protein [Planctomycetota bacterium]